MEPHSVLISFSLLFTLSEKNDIELVTGQRDSAATCLFYLLFFLCCNLIILIFFFL